jgi:hypothetical protein
MSWRAPGLMSAGIVLLAATLLAQTPEKVIVNEDGDDERPLVTKTDVKIVRRAKEILNSPSKWNRADTRMCPGDAKTFSLYCALEKATNEVNGNFEHRGAAMQEARFLIDEITRRRNYQHRLMEYNNDPTTKFSDIQKVFRLLESRVALRLKEESQVRRH